MLEKPRFKNPNLNYYIKRFDIQTIVTLPVEEDRCYPEDYFLIAKYKNITELDVERDEGVVDFSVFTPVEQLEYLWIRAMFCAWPISCTNLQALQSLKRLKLLEIADFTDFDLEEIVAVPQLEELRLMFGNEVKHVDQIAHMPNLKRLKLSDVTVKSLDFLHHLPSTVKLELRFLNVEEEFDINALKRFETIEVEDITINGKTYEKL